MSNPSLSIAAAFLLLTIAPAVSEHVVTQKDKNFSRTTLTVRSGDTIVFKNDDPVVHNVFSKSDVVTFNAMQDPGDETKVAVETTGTFVVRCAIHPKMKLTVKVE
jgi:plastocyanin